MGRVLDPSAEECKGSAIRAHAALAAVPFQASDKYGVLRQRPRSVSLPQQLQCALRPVYLHPPTQLPHLHIVSVHPLDQSHSACQKPVCPFARQTDDVSSSHMQQDQCPFMPVYPQFAPS